MACACDLNGTQVTDDDSAGISSSFLHAKCTIRNVSFNGPDDFFEKTMLNYVKNQGKVAGSFDSGSSQF